jgi:hypothetical protein
MTPAQAYKPAHGGYPQVAGFPYASLGAAKAQAQRDAEARRRAADILWDEPHSTRLGCPQHPMHNTASWPVLTTHTKA